MANSKYTPGIAGIWTEEGAFLKAAKKVRESGYDKVDAISPYPIHGMEDALQIERSAIPYITFIAGVTGCLIGLWLCWWTSAVNWPVNIGGRPYFALPAYIPIIFELTILFAALSSVAALFIFCRLPKVDPPIIDPDLTCHKFALFIPKTQSQYDETKVTQLYKELGAIEVKKMTEY